MPEENKKTMRQLRGDLKQEYNDWLKTVSKYSDPVDYVGWLEIHLISERGLVRNLSGNNRAFSGSADKSE